MEGQGQDSKKGFKLIQELAIELRVSKECLATAYFYLQKYTASSLRKFKSLHMSGACVFLACKVLEQPRHVEPLCKKLYLLHSNTKIKANPNLQFPPISSQMLSKLKDTILFHEFLLLEEIGFNVTVKLPYKSITKAVESLGLPIAMKNNILRTAYRFANDFFVTSAPLVKSHTNIAEACIFLASKAYKLDLGCQPDQETLRIFNLAVKL